MRIDKDYKYLALSLLFIIASINLTRTTLAILKSSKRLENTKNELVTLQKEQENLEKSISYKKSDAYVEKTARDELNMAKPGEDIVIVKGLPTASSKQPKVLSGASVLETNNTLSMVRRVKNVKAWFMFFENKFL